MTLSREKITEKIPAQADHAPCRRQSEGVAQHHHPQCFACGKGNGGGLGLQFTVCGQGVCADFMCSCEHCGYEGMLHGGVISTLLDAAMTHCLFADGIVAVTAEITVKFRRPVQVGAPVSVRAWREESFGVFHLTRAELVQDNRVAARARGKFVSRKNCPGKAGSGPATPNHERESS
jgi:uncharacterized protein (TIGR00369 family)